jgi:hypothetical membrane protein
VSSGFPLLPYPLLLYSTRMTPLAPVPPLILSYAHGPSAAPFRIPLWLLAGLVPAAIAIPIDFTWHTSPLRVLTQAAESPRHWFQFDSDLGIICLALGLSLALPALLLSCLIGRAPRTAHIVTLCLLPLTAISMFSAAFIVWPMTHNPPHLFVEWASYLAYFAVLLTGLGFLIRDIRRRCPLTQLTLLALTTVYFGIALFCLIVFCDNPNRGYFFTVVGCPFYFLLALRLIRHRPASQ